MPRAFTDLDITNSKPFFKNNTVGAQIENYKLLSIQPPLNYAVFYYLMKRTSFGGSDREQLVVFYPSCICIFSKFTESATFPNGFVIFKP